MTVKIGALVPGSRMFPGADRDFINGISAALRAHEIPHDLAIESIGNAAIKDVVTDRAQRLLLTHRPHIVTGIIGSGIAPFIHAAFREYRVPFIVNNLGAEPLRIEDQRNHYLIHNSLNIWQSAYAMGVWAAANIGKKAVLAASFHEAGYDMVRAFWQGFAHIGGGEVLRMEVTHRENATDDPSEQLKILLDAQPDFITGFYSGREGISFLDAFARLGRHGDIPLVATPMITHQRWLSQAGTAAEGLRTVFSWDRTQSPQAHEQFRNACAIQSQEEPAVFALLGYETGTMIAQVIDRMGIDGSDGEGVSEALANISFASPRGQLRVDPTTGDVLTTDFLQEVRATPNGFDAITMQPLDTPVTCVTDRAIYKNQPARAGWLNPYLIN